jgi:hypothetical protein
MNKACGGEVQKMSEWRREFFSEMKEFLVLSPLLTAVGACSYHIDNNRSEYRVRRVSLVKALKEHFCP